MKEVPKTVNSVVVTLDENGDFSYKESIMKVMEKEKPRCIVKDGVKKLVIQSENSKEAIAESELVLLNEKVIDFSQNSPELLKFENHVLSKNPNLIAVCDVSLTRNGIDVYESFLRKEDDDDMDELVPNNGKVEKMDEGWYSCTCTRDKYKDSVETMIDYAIEDTNSEIEKHKLDLDVYQTLKDTAAY